MARFFGSIGVVILVFLSLASATAFAGTKCFLVIDDDGKVLKQEGECDTRRSPCSTFKIAISLMAFEEGLLFDETHPLLPYNEEYRASLEQQRQSQNPTSWMRNSAVWYSQLVTRQLGIEKFRHYVDLLNYGNKDVAGDPGQNNGLTRAWLSSSLRVSPREQTTFLTRLVRSQLPFSSKSQRLTRNIAFVEDFADEFRLYGKTGTGYRPRENGAYDPDRQVGWFVGWLQRDDRFITFAHYIEDEDKEEAYAGPRARELAKQKLLAVI